MTSLYTILDAVGIPEDVAEIVAEYDDDPFGEQRWKDEQDAIEARYTREIQEHEERQERIIAEKLKYTTRIQKKKALVRLRMNIPVRDFRTAESRYKDICTAFPEDSQARNEARAVLQQFERERNTILLDLLKKNFGTHHTNSAYRFPPVGDDTIAWINCRYYRGDTDFERLIRCINNNIREKYRLALIENTELELLPDISLSDLNRDFPIYIPYSGGYMCVPIEKLATVADLHNIPVRANGIIWEIKMDTLFTVIDEKKFEKY